MDKTNSYGGKTGTIALSGFMGCGKSSVGKELSTLLSCPFIDLDEYIASRERRSIPEIFTTSGEPAFRDMELTYLKEILVRHSALDAESPTLVLSLGGGTLTTPECASLIAENTVCIYLRTTTDTLVARLQNEAAQRPMLSLESTLRNRIEDLMQKRSAIYESTARHILDTDGKSVPEIAREIIRF